MTSEALHTPDDDRLAGILGQLREEAGLSQVELAERLGRPTSFVSGYESGESRLELTDLRAVWVALGVELSELADRFETGEPMGHA